MKTKSVHSFTFVTLKHQYCGRSVSTSSDLLVLYIYLKNKKRKKKIRSIANFHRRLAACFYKNKKKIIILIGIERERDKESCIDVKCRYFLLQTYSKFIKLIWINWKTGNVIYEYRIQRTNRSSYLLNDSRLGFSQIN